ncbi:MAG: ABC transporter permease DevC [Planctomycetaceae bacterium]
MWRDLPIAWLQLTHSKAKFTVAVTGVVVAVLLMWMQLGFLDALYRSATSVARHLRGDLVLLSPNTKTFMQLEPFAKRHIARSLGHEGVANVYALYVGMAMWKNPWNGEKRRLFVFGMEPDYATFEADDLEELLPTTLAPDVGIFDAASRPEFGPVGKSVRHGEPVAAEINGRLIRIAGVTTIGAGFQADGNFVTSTANYLRIMNDPRSSIVQVGLIRLKPGADSKQVQRDLAAMYGNEMTVMTTDEVVAREYDFLTRTAPIGFVFTLGTIVGCVIGFAIVYQVLYTDISNHLPQFATLKAMGYTDRYLASVVVQEALILAAAGFVPGSLLGMALFAVAKAATMLPMYVTWDRAIEVFVLTFTMCTVSGLLAMRRLRAADPAEIF